jgi:acyl carrier protein
MRGFMSNISFELFYAELKKDLNIPNDSIFEESLKDMPQFDSIGKILASLTIEKVFGFQIPLDDLNNIESIRNLYNYCVSRVNSEK